MSTANRTKGPPPRHPSARHGLLGETEAERAAIERAKAEARMAKAEPPPREWSVPRLRGSIMGR